MATWKNKRIYENQIKYDTGTSTLIKMPHSSKYDGFVFWHPSKLVRNDFKTKMLTVGYTDEFVFHLKKYGNGKYNSREVLAEKDITAADFEEAFANNLDDYGKHEDEEPLIHTPEKIEPENAVADESLVDND